MRHIILCQCLFGHDLATPAHQAKWPMTKMQCALKCILLPWPRYIVRGFLPYSHSSQTTCLHCHLQAEGQYHEAITSPIFNDSDIWLSFPFLIHSVNTVWNYQNSSLKTTWKFSRTQHIFRTQFSSVFTLISTMISSNFTVFWDLWALILFQIFNISWNVCCVITNTFSVAEYPNLTL